MDEAELAAALELKSGLSPFPWQLALLNEKLLEGNIPRAIDVPTGLGKTSVMTLWLVARARGARLPRRLVYVVDRRAVVDQATKEAERLRAFVDRTPVVKRSLALERSLPISTLRGQHADNRAWLEDPASPAIIVGTVDMIGSRLLFEGYRCSRKMRPYHAAMMGVDALIVLDEAHLTPAFERLLETLASRSPTFAPAEAAQRSLIPSVELMSLSATGRARNGVFTLTDEDEAHPVVQERLDATKRLEIQSPLDPDETSLHDALAEHAWRVSENGVRACRVIVFCDRRETAEKVQKALESRRRPAKSEGPAFTTELFVGGRRVFERQQAEEWLATSGFIAGEEGRPSVATFLIATSAGEVGVDLDADDLVCDVVAWERMVQRFGRVNRRGGKGRAARVVVVPANADKATRVAIEKDAKIKAARAKVDSESANDDEDDDEDEEKAAKKLNAKERTLVSRREIVAASLRALHELERRHHGAAPRALRSLKRESAGDPDLANLLASATTPAPLHPELTRAVVESWSMTSLAEHSGRPSVRPWLRGWVDDEDSQTTLVWRRHLPIVLNADATQSLAPSRDRRAFLDAAPVHALEVLEAETWHIVEWLKKRAGAIAKRKASNPQPSDSPEGEEQSVREPLDGDDIVALVVSDDEERRSEDRRELRLRDLLQLDKIGQERLEERLAGATLMVDVRLGGLTNGLLDAASDHAADVGEAVNEDLRLPFRVLEASPGVSADATDGWREEVRLPWRLDADGNAIAHLVVRTDPRNAAETEEGRSTTTGHNQTLAEHQAWVKSRASALATRLELGDYEKVLALAALLHDEGKRAPNWQRAFKAPAGGPWAKTTSRPNIALLDGYRHELGSLLDAARDPRINDLSPDRRDLVLHLIASHHGFARPLISTRGCDAAPPSALVARAREIALRFTRLEERWGPWGLAWWEALLRAADQQASAENDARGKQHG